MAGETRPAAPTTALASHRDPHRPFTSDGEVSTVGIP